MLRYVVYTRVSTEDQGKSGLGLEAQERDIGIFLDRFSAVPYEIIGRFQDVDSGANNGRPELNKALALVRKTGAELLIAKLDRLSRKVSFIATLMDDPKVKLRVAQMPQADKFQLHIYAALAEQERTFISERTKAALRVAKERGVKLGGHEGRHHEAERRHPGQGRRRGGQGHEADSPDAGSRRLPIADRPHPRRDGDSHIPRRQVDGHAGQPSGSQDRLG
ncbi:DNA invertase Pin-like site-specific DNA recombinase [Sinorhizobium fredii]